MHAARVEVRVLGPVEVRVDGVVASLGGPRPRTVLARLLADSGRVVPVDKLIDSLWGDDAGIKAVDTLQVHVSNLRRDLAAVTEALGRPVIVRKGPGYLVDVDGAWFDAATFAEHVRRAHASDSARGRAAELRSALSLWTGRPYDGAGDEGDLPAIRAALESSRAQALRSMLDAEVESGRHRDVLDEVTAAAARHPLDEGLQGLLMLTLYRCGRPADALGVFTATRERLTDELGVDPSPELRAMEALVLRHDPRLAATVGPVPGVEEDPTIVRTARRASAASVAVDGRTHRLERAVVTIGRAADRTIVLDDGLASRNHAEIRWIEAGHLIVDVGSANGTKVNGALVHEHLLSDGDVIEIGSTSLAFSC